MIKEWNSWTTYQKIALSIYTILSLPLLPLMVVLVPFVWATTTSESSASIKLTLAEFLSLSMAVSILCYLILAAMLWIPK